MTDELRAMAKHIESLAERYDALGSKTNAQVCRDQVAEIAKQLALWRLEGVPFPLVTTHGNFIIEHQRILAQTEQTPEAIRAQQERTTQAMLQFIEPVRPSASPATQAKRHARSRAWELERNKLARLLSEHRASAELESSHP